MAEKFPFNPVRDQLTGVNYAENVRHLIVRIALTNLLMEDKRVNALFRRWEEVTGFSAAIHQCAAHAAHVTHMSGFTSFREYADALKRGDEGATLYWTS